MGRWPWATLCVVAQLACGGLTPPADIPVTETSLDEAAAVVRETAAQNPNFQLVEGGISVEAYQWAWRDHTVVEPMIVGSIVWVGTPRIVRERELVGPAPYYVPFRRLAGVAVRRWAIGAGIELSVEDATEPLFVEMKDAQTAQRLADALELLRRARHNETPEEKGPLPPSAGE
jgi:hypothetical protein